MLARPPTGVRVIVAVLGLAGSFALLGLTPAPLLTVPVLLAAVVGSGIMLWRALGDLADELEAETAADADPAEVWGVAGWPAPSAAELRAPSRAERTRLIAEVEEYLADPGNAA